MNIEILIYKQKSSKTLIESNYHTGLGIVYRNLVTLRLSEDMCSFKFQTAILSDLCIDVRISFMNVSFTPDRVKRPCPRQPDLSLSRPLVNIVRPRNRL